jgi:hypothetical protein
MLMRDDGGRGLLLMLRRAPCREGLVRGGALLVAREREGVTTRRECQWQALCIALQLEGRAAVRTTEAGNWSHSVDHDVLASCRDLRCPHVHTAWT